MERKFGVFGTVEELNRAADGKDADGQKSAGGNNAKILSDTGCSSHEIGDGNVVPSVLGLAGDSGKSGGLPDHSPLNEVPGGTQEDFDQLLGDLVHTYFDAQNAIEPLMYEGWKYITLEKAHEAYKLAIDLAAVLERILIAKQKEAAKRDV